VLNRPGLPADAPRFVSPRLEELAALADAWKDGRRPDAALAARLSSDELLVYLQRLPREMTPPTATASTPRCARRRGNHEILAQWLSIAASSGYEPAFPASGLCSRPSAA